MALNYYIFWNFFLKTYCFRIKKPLNIRLETAVIECHYTPLRIILSSGFYCLAGCGSNTTPLGNIPITCIARRPAIITFSQLPKPKEQKNRCPKPPAQTCLFLAPGVLLSKTPCKYRFQRFSQQLASGLKSVQFIGQQSHLE